MREPFGLILAGGRGTRMGGVSKADLILGHSTLLTQAQARLEPQVVAIAVNSNAPITTNLPVIKDATRDHLGPLEGVLAGLDWAVSQGGTHIVTVAVDTPFFPCDLVPRLLMAGQTHPNGFAIASTSDGLHGTFGIWPTTLRDELATFLDQGQRKVRAFTQAQAAATAIFPDTTPPSFFNINTPEDLATAAQWL
ncbi:putative molybdopterin-guanine dinucleotide biosynthesis protein A [Octadecabacter antarcticus 307]|uniref:Molybdenum cofactor guanylyltransferase n=1 Tax=Octadecabacter antarcticus 307 TaxID=391626 RepID=M9R016_9RHOB|nr:molybdenum cofactor guanylyltransferase MobA [Octadecabacter antarcticus]AGI65939.1 putative molybdopterin-guanine dinucleotide biosynthesis protein A [Octadecabacter antarcticus 307]